MPTYYFRVDELKEANDAFSNHDNNGNWIPSVEAGANVKTGTGASGQWFCYDGQGISATSLPQGARPYKVCSLYYESGQGMWVLDGDAADPRPDLLWRPLRFEWDENNYSSYLTTAGENKTIRVQRTDQAWPQLLLPDIYHTTTRTPYQQYGGLKGDLPIFLALIALSMHPSKLRQTLPFMFQSGSWKIHNLPHGRYSRRGVVVYVWSQEERNTLEQLEDGALGLYYH